MHVIFLWKITIRMSSGDLELLSALNFLARRRSSEEEGGNKASLTPHNAHVSTKIECLQNILDLQYRKCPK